MQVYGLDTAFLSNSNAATEFSMAPLSLYDGMHCKQMIVDVGAECDELRELRGEAPHNGIKR
jgi:hypothetical protein